MALFVEGAGAETSSAAGPEAGSSAGVNLPPGAGGDETSLSGEEAESLDGEAAGVEEEEVGGVAEASGEETVGLEADELWADTEALGAEADDDDVGAEAGDDDDDGVAGEALGELVGASRAWTATNPAMATQTRAKTTTWWRAIIFASLLFWVFCFLVFQIQTDRVLRETSKMNLKIAVLP